MTASNEVVGLSVAGLATLREALGSALTSAQFQRAWGALVDQLVTEISFAFLDGVEVGQAGIASTAVSARVADIHGQRIREMAARAIDDLRADDIANRRGAASYWDALRQFANKHGLDLAHLPTFTDRLRMLEQFEPSVDPNYIRSELDAALEILTAPKRKD